MNRRPLSFQLFLIVALTAFPLIVSSFILYAQLLSNARETTRRSLVSSAKILAGLVDNEIDTHIAILSTLAESPTLDTDDVSGFWREAKKAVEFIQGAAIALSDPDGQLRLTTVEPPGKTLPRHPAPDVLRRAVTERKIQVSDLTFGPVSQQFLAFAALPIFKDGQPRHVISITLLPDRFLHLIEQSVEEGHVIGILDGNRKFVARHPDHRQRIGTPPAKGWQTAMDRSPEGWFDSPVLEGDPAVQGYARNKAGWTVGVAALKQELDQPVRKIFWSGAGLIAGSTLLSALLAGYLARRTNRGMNALDLAAASLATGAEVRPSTGPFAEATRISSTLSAASAQLARQRVAIEKHQHELEAKIGQRTQELQAEVKRRAEAEHTLRQAQKMEAIGQLTGGIAHDFNNMLTIVLGNLDVIRRRIQSIENTSVLARPIESAIQGANNAAQLTHRLLAFARQQPLEPKPVDLNATVRGMSHLIMRTVGEDIHVETVLAAGLWTVFADASQIESCLLNLVINARDAMPKGGKLTIETGNVFLDEAYVARFGDIAMGRYALLSVTDSGAGIPPEALDRVFEPFFTTKETGKGTGLGLAMVHGFCRQSGGHVRIYSELGNGTTVKIYLPRHNRDGVPAAPRGAQEKISSPRRAQEDETVLLVEDDAGVRDYAVTALEDLGYSVLAAATGNEAIAYLSSEARIDLLFTDVVLAGGISGRQVADRARELRPSLKILYTTGYTRNAIVHQGRLDEGVLLLQKPYTQRDLAEKIKQAIEGR